MSDCLPACRLLVALYNDADDKKLATALLTNGYVINTDWQNNELQHGNLFACLLHTKRSLSEIQADVYQICMTERIIFHAVIVSPRDINMVWGGSNSSSNRWKQLLREQKEVVDAAMAALSKEEEEYQVKTIEMRKHIRAFVARNPGTTGTAMIPALVDESWVPMETDFVDLLFQMVKEGELREEEYVDPRIPYRVKSRFYVQEGKQ